jgi:topoisomerase IA-like protein
VLIQEKRESDANKFIAEFSKEDIQVLMGRYGAYIKKGKKIIRYLREKKLLHSQLRDAWK